VEEGAHSHVVVPGNKNYLQSLDDKKIKYRKSWPRQDLLRSCGNCPLRLRASPET